MAQNVQDKHGVTSMVLGIISVVIPIVGIVTGILAIHYAKKQKAIAPNGMATAGMVTGIVGLAFSGLFLLWVIIWLLIFLPMMAYMI